MNAAKMMPRDRGHFVKLDKIGKSFYGVDVLKDISVGFRKGEIHVLCGENGAGKSTLMKILSGLYIKDTGKILIDGKEAVINTSEDGRKYGIAMVPQELELCPTISVCENIFLAREFGKFFINKRKMRNQSRIYMDMLGLKVSPDQIVGELSIGKMQMVLIAKALAQNAKVLIMDEPCSSLTEDESDKLFKLLLSLKLQGIGTIYIDHRIDNFEKIGDRVSVLRDGKLVGTLDMRDATKETIVHMMVGRTITEQFPKYSQPARDVKLKVRHLSNQKIKDICFDVYTGEIFGLAGLVGSGRSEVVRAIFGVDKIEARGTISLNGKLLKKISPRLAIKKGIGYVPEDRKLQSLIMHKSLSWNLSLVNLDEINTGPLLDEKAIQKTSAEQIRELRIKVIDPNARVAEMSGGNQQKVVLGRWLIGKNLQVFLLDEPTRGVDVGVKQEIYKVINELAQKGIAIILITSELPELIGLSDRIAVVNDGEINHILERKEFSQEKIMQLCV